jgi:hypothetical protein
MEKLMDDRQMMDVQSELEYELTVIFEDLEQGNMLTASQIDTLRYASGFPKKTRVTPVLAEVFNDFSNIFGGKQ